MKRARLAVVSLVLLAALALPLAGRPAQAMYPQMLPLSQYMMDRSAEIALAQTAAPPALAKNATVLVLTAQGYQVGKQGSNGFTCIVERGWMPPFDQKDFWSPNLRAPICYNAAASRTVLQYTLDRTKLALAGLSRTQIYDRIKAMPLPTPEPGSMSYMLSKEQRLGEKADSNWYPHLMFHLPKSYSAGDGASWGANLTGSPVVFDDSHHMKPEPQTILMVPVGNWSDGTAAPPMKAM
jgi:hypothetical protein